MMGVGNLTELTDADTSGINAILFGIISELNISHVLATEVSPHARNAIREADIARRMMYAAQQDNSLPRDITGDLLIHHDRRPFPDSDAEIRDLSATVKDPNYRIKISANGVSLFNRDGFWQEIDPFAFYPYLNVDADTGHAFYLGVELARAEIAWQLGKRYNQDEPLRWGTAVQFSEQDLRKQTAEGTTLRKQNQCGPPEKPARKSRKRSQCGPPEK